MPHTPAAAPLLERIRQRVRHLKTETLALYLVARHPHTPWYSKLVVAVIVAYVLTPADPVPDVFPILGLVDDLIFIPLGLAIAVKVVPADVLAECRSRAQQASVKPMSRFTRTVIVLVWMALGAWCAVEAYEMYLSEHRAINHSHHPVHIPSENYRSA